MVRYVNCKTSECTHYVGRKEDFYKAIGSPLNLSILGNPFYLNSFKSRSDCIMHYKEYLLDACKRSYAVRDLVLSIPDDAILGCFCFPKACHCQAIIEIREILKDNKL